MLQAMEGSMSVIDDILVRMKELAEQAATGSYSSAQRIIMNAEFVELANEVDRVSEATSFNGISMLNTSTGSVAIHVGTATTIDIDKVDMTKTGLGIDAGAGSAEYVATIAGIADADATWFTTAATAEVFAIKFGTEATITVDTFEDSTAYTMNEVADLINAASRAASDYNAAEVVYDSDTAQYKLKISAEDAGDVAVDYTGNTFNSSGKGLDDSDNLLGVAGVAGGTVNILTAADATNAFDTITDAINTKDEARAMFGYKMKRLESTVAIVDTQAENMIAAESRISDVDVATEMAKMTRTQVLAQAGVSMLYQANQMPQMALQLLR
jgi:flagellin